MRSTQFLKRLVLAITVLAMATISLVAPIPQDLAYHDFADQRALWFVPNLSNEVQKCTTSHRKWCVKVHQPMS